MAEEQLEKEKACGKSGVNRTYYNPRNDIKDVDVKDPVDIVKDQYIDMEMPDLAEARSQRKLVDTYGEVRPRKKKEFPGVTTLLEKSVKSSRLSSQAQLLALAGCAEKQYENSFGKIERQVRELKMMAQSMISLADTISNDIRSLKNLAVVDEYE